MSIKKQELDLVGKRGIAAIFHYYGDIVYFVLVRGPTWGIDFTGELKFSFT